MKNNAPIVTLIIPSQKGFEKLAMSIAQCLATEMELSQKKIERLKTALAEACLNAMEHGNRFKPDLDVTVRFIKHPSKLEITVQDAGMGGRISFPQAKPDIDAKVLGQASKRGWGLFLIKNLVDEVLIDSLPTGGSTVRLVSYLENTSEQMSK